MAERVLTLRELGRATLARQLLLRRHGLPLAAAVERVAGLQGQWSPAPYVGLWSRLAPFRREKLERALLQRRIVKATLMRTTLHLVTAGDYAIFSSALNGGTASQLSPEAVELGARFADRARALLGESPLSRTEIVELLKRNHGFSPADAAPWMSWYSLRVHAHIVHAPACALWKLAPSMLHVALDGVVLPDPDEARIELVRRYLRAFGPASRADISQWSGLRIRDIAPALDALEPLRRFRDEEGRELVDVPRAPLPAAGTAAPVRMLPKWDSLLLAHDDRQRVLPDEYRKVVIAKNGDVAQTFLVDGLVAGTWVVHKGKVGLEPFAPLPRAMRRELEDEARRLEAFILAR